MGISVQITNDVPDVTSYLFVYLHATLIIRYSKTSIELKIFNRSIKWHGTLR